MRKLKDEKIKIWEDEKIRILKDRNVRRNVRRSEDN